LGDFDLNLNADKIINEKHPSGWHYFSGSQWRPRIIWGNLLGSGAEPGKQTTFEITSKLPPVLMECEVRGEPKHRSPYIVSIDGKKITEEEYWKQFPDGYEKDELAIRPEDNCVSG
jgi:hypothetical protein